MSTDDCIFCKMVSGQIPVTKIYEDETVLAFLDIGPLSEGHTLVIPRQHVERLHNCPADVLGHVGSCIGKIAKAVNEAVKLYNYRRVHQQLGYRYPMEVRVAA